MVARTTCTGPSKTDHTFVFSQKQKHQTDTFFAKQFIIPTDQPNFLNPDSVPVSHLFPKTRRPAPFLGPRPLLEYGTIIGPLKITYRTDQPHAGAPPVGPVSKTRHTPNVMKPLTGQLCPASAVSYCQNNQARSTGETRSVAL